jgi:hypothetical protein
MSGMFFLKDKKVTVGGENLHKIFFSQIFVRLQILFGRINK